MAFSHTSQLPKVVFDDRRVIADAGLLLPASLAHQLGIGALFDNHVSLGKRAGHAHVGAKALTVVAALLAGADSIEESGSLRLAGMEQVLGHRAPAASTLGTFLRSFELANLAQLERVAEQLLGRAWQVLGGPGQERLTIDLDSTICETYGVKKQGARQLNYAKVRGYQPFLAVAAESGEVLHCRLRSGNASPHRGAAHFLDQTLGRVRRSGAQGEIVVRADSGFYIEKLIHACQRHNARFSVTARLYGNLAKLIHELPESAWTPIPWIGGRAAVAETSYLAFANSHRPGRHRAVSTRLIVRRIESFSGDQLQLPGLGYRYHAFITDRDGDALELESEHRQHAVIENTIRQLKYDLGLNHLPSGRFAANAVWLHLNVLAHNLSRWLAQAGLGGLALTVKTLRRRFFSVPGRVVRSGRQVWLRLPRHWPWAPDFLTVLGGLRSLSPPSA
ncbi:MAG TPA: IS1380 family transposase [Dermatophilaceae bacterium]